MGDSEAPQLLTIREAADRLGAGVKPKALRRIAEETGFLIKIGQTPMIETSDLQKIVELCRVPKPSHGPSTLTKASETRDDELAISGGESARVRAEAAARQLLESSRKPK